jgi:hypothetical protein
MISKAEIGEPVTGNKCPSQKAVGRARRYGRTFGELHSGSRGKKADGSHRYMAKALSVPDEWPIFLGNRGGTANFSSSWFIQEDYFYLAKGRKK